MLKALVVASYLSMLSSDELCSAELDRLLAIYDSYGLPHPPRDASLVVFVAGGYHDLATDSYGKSISTRTPMLGFSRDGKTVLDEFGRPFAVWFIKAAKPDPATFEEDVELGWPEDAIQYHARGWKELARSTLRKWVNSHQYVWALPERYLCDSAWYSWKRRLHHDPEMPLETIAKYLKRIHPALGGYPRPAERQKLLASLDLSLKPSNSRPGSDEALIDALIEARGREPLPSWDPTGFRQDPRYLALVKRGFDAVPALIAHLNDDRLTRCYWNVCGWTDHRVKDIALDILIQLRGEWFEGAWRGILEDGVPDALLKEIRSWYADARKLGEEKYILTRLLGDDQEEENHHPGLLYLLAEKYPQRLPEVFRKYVDTPKEHARFAWDYAKAVAEAKLPDADKRKALDSAAKQKQPTVRAAGIYYLRRFDPKLAKERLLPALAEIPDTWDGDTGLAFIVAEGADVDAWKALSLAIRRANASRQADLLCAVLCAKTPEGWKHRLAFLSEYLTEVLSGDAHPGRAAQAEAQHIATGLLPAFMRIAPKPYPMDWTAGQDYEELYSVVKGTLWP